MSRALALLIAIACWVGLGIQLVTSARYHHDVVAALWVLVRFFTIITNFLLALVMTTIAAGRRLSPFIVGGVTLAIMLVGAVYATLLQGLHQLEGPKVLADVLLHKVTPVAAACWWLLFAPRTRLPWTAPLWWATYPLAYFVYVLARGQHDGRYPYPFIDVAKLGYLQVALNAGGIAAAFVLAGLALVWIERVHPLGQRRGRR